MTEKDDIIALVKEWFLARKKFSGKTGPTDLDRLANAEAALSQAASTLIREEMLRDIRSARRKLNSAT